MITVRQDQVLSGISILLFKKMANTDTFYY